MLPTACNIKKNATEDRLNFHGSNGNYNWEGARNCIIHLTFHCCSSLFECLRYTWIIFVEEDKTKCLKKCAKLILN
jgi:hypothetical protein